MAADAGWGGAIATIWAAIAVAGCLDTNPKFVEPPQPTEGASEGATTTSSATTQVMPTTTGVTATTSTTGTLTESGSDSDSDTESPVTSETTDTSGTSSSTGMVTSTSTGMAPVCGDKVVDAPEQCDEGPGNADDGDCTTQCLFAVCGDGLKHLSLEECDDVNGDPTDGCIDCKVPRTCNEVQSLFPMAATGQYFIDPDGPGPGTQIPVFCDMTTAGGGWTLYERSPLSDPIGRALYLDMPVNMDQPMMSSYRMPKQPIGSVMQMSSELWIGCGGNDHLLADAMDLFKGEFGPQDCTNWAQVVYKEAELKGVKLVNTPLCTQFFGFNDAECPGAWSIDETWQQVCTLPSFPWTGDVFTSDGADTFATDASVKDTLGMIHDCHKPGATRVVMLR